MCEDSEGSVWAIVADTGGKKYIGEIVISLKDAGDIVLAVTDGIPIKMKNAWAFIEMDLPLSGPQGPVGIQRVCHCRPANNCEGPCSFWVVPTMIHLFSDMSGADIRRNKGLVEQVIQNSMKNRAERANIALVPAGALPRGFRGPGGTS